MGGKLSLPRFPRVNWKTFIALIVIVLFAVIATKGVVKLMSGGEAVVGYEIVKANDVPEKLGEIIPRYKMLERALATEVDGSVYVIVTRGEKLTGGYTVDVESLNLVKENEENKLVVHAVFKDPSENDVVSQNLSYPYVVLKTDLTSLPDKIDLKVRYLE